MGFDSSYSGSGIKDDWITITMFVVLFIFVSLVIMNRSGHRSAQFQERVLADLEYSCVWFATTREPMLRSGLDISGLVQLSEDYDAIARNHCGWFRCACACLCYAPSRQWRVETRKLGQIVRRAVNRWKILNGHNSASPVTVTCKHGNKTACVVVDESFTGLDLKEHLLQHRFDKDSYFDDRMLVTFAGVTIAANETLAMHSVIDGAVIEVVQNEVPLNWCSEYKYNKAGVMNSEGGLMDATKHTSTSTSTKETSQEVILEMEMESSQF